LGPELAGAGIDEHRSSVANSDVGNAGNERLRLGRADPNRLRLVSRALVADVNVVIAGASVTPAWYPMPMFL